MKAVTLIVLLGLAASACGGEEPPPRVREAAVAAPQFDVHGLAVELPPGWHRATEPLTPTLTDPREVLAVATFPLHYRETGCAHIAGSALEGLAPAGAFVTLLERGYGETHLPPRPAKFGPELGGPSEASECVPDARFTDHWFQFSDGGRLFHVDVAFGPDTPESVRRQAWAILDGLRVDPNVKPDWESSG